MSNDRSTYEFSPKVPRGTVEHNADTPLEFSREREPFAYNPRDSEAGGVDSFGNLTGDAAEAERRRRAEQMLNMFDEQRRRDEEMRAARQLALGGRLGRSGSAKPRDERRYGFDAQHDTDYEAYKRIVEGS